MRTDDHEVDIAFARGVQDPIGGCREVRRDRLDRRLARASEQRQIIVGASNQEVGGIRGSSELLDRDRFGGHRAEQDELRSGELGEAARGRKDDRCAR